MATDEEIRKRRIARFVLILTLVLTLQLPFARLQSQTQALGLTDAVPCSQSTARREALMQRAERLRFTVRRVEFVGTTYTRDEELRRRMTNFQEGDLFTRQKLVNSLRSMSKLQSEIYPVKLKNVELQLNEPDQTVDMTICVKAKRH